MWHSQAIHKLDRGYIPINQINSFPSSNKYRGMTDACFCHRICNFTVIQGKNADFQYNGTIKCIFWKYSYWSMVTYEIFSIKKVHNVWDM